MDLIKCPECGEMFSSSYPRCPFCEEDGASSRKIKYTPRRRIADKQKALSARGGLIVVLVLVLALLGWYLFGGKKPEQPVSGTDKPPVNTDQPAIPASNPAANDPFYEPDASAPADGETGGETDTTGGEGADAQAAVEPTPVAQPVEDENVDVSNAKLNHTDVTLGYEGEKFTLKLTGTEATPHWSIENGNVVSMTADGVVTARANGRTTIHCKAGTRDLTCIVRVNGTGKTAGSADAPTVIEAVTPTAPAAPGTTATTAPTTPTTPTAPAETTPSTPSTSSATTSVSGSLHLKTNVTGELPRDHDTNKYDITVKSGNPDSIRLIVYDDDKKEIKINWTSADTSVATISDDGRITTVGRGKTLITGTVGDKKVECIVRVS